MVWLSNNWWHVAQPLPAAAWSPEQGSPFSARPPHQQCWRSDSPEIQAQAPLPPKVVVFFCWISSPKWFTDWLQEQLCWPEERVTQAPHQVSFHLFLKTVSDRAFLIFSLPAGGKACSQESLFSHFCKEQPKHQPTTKHFSTCFIVYKDHVQQEIAHYFPPFSIDLGLSLIKCNIYLGL